MSKEKITLMVLGDVIINRDEPKSIFAHVVDVLNTPDILFANCDQTYSDKHPPAPLNPLGSDPDNIPALVYAGLDVVSLANNHTLDFGIPDLLDTIERVKKAGIKVVGVGKNISEARQPEIMERKGTKVGFLAYNCLGPDGYEAWEDKPGCAPMRAYTVYDKWDYQPGTPPRIISVAYPDDLAAMKDDIRKLRAQVDVVAISFHWGLHFQPAIIPMYAFEVGHVAIDAGADLIIGNHAHILKPIEVYKGKVVFHALNNFAAEMRRGLPPPPYPGRPGPFQMYGFKRDPETGEHPEARPTMIGKIIIDDGKIQKVSYIPCWVNKDKQPEIITRDDPKAEQVFDYVEKITRSQNLSTKFAWDGNEVLIS